MILREALRDLRIIKFKFRVIALISLVSLILAIYASINLSWSMGLLGLLVFIGSSRIGEGLLLDLKEAYRRVDALELARTGFNNE